MALPRLVLPGSSSGIEIGYVENITGTTQTLTTSFVTLGLSLTVPLSDRPIYIRAKCLVDCTTAATSGTSGTALMVIRDDQGSPVDLEGDVTTFEGANGTAGYQKLVCEGRIEAGTPARVYTIFVSKGGDSAFAARIMNGANSAQYRSSLKAIYA